MSHRNPAQDLALIEPPRAGRTDQLAAVDHSGLIALTRTPRPAHSTAAVRVRLTTAALAAQ
jgi:hypothetical protein